MTRAKLSAVALAGAICLLTGCSGGSSNSAAPATAAQTPSGSACDRKLIATQDVASLFSEPVVETKNIPGDPQSCSFNTAGFSSVTISVRPGHGRASVGTYSSGKMNEYEKSEALAGVGDEAVRSLSLNRVIARKDDLLCEITGPGMAPAANDPMTFKLGALCNKIFAAY